MMKNLKHIPGTTALLALVLALFSSDAFCQSAPKIALEAESNKVGVGEVLSVTIEISTENDKPQKVTLPDFAGFDVFSKSVSSPLQFSFGMGQGVKMTYTTRYDLGLMGKTVGTHKIGPVVVKMGGKEYESDTIVVEVTKEPQGLGKKKPDWPGSPFGPDPFKDFDDMFKRQFDRFPTPDIQPPQQSEPPVETTQPPEGLDGAKYDPNVFVRTVVAPKKIYMGQQATLDFYVYSRVSVTNIDVTKEPAGGKFWTKDLLPPTGKVDFSPIDIGGVTFSVATLRKIAIFPTEAGLQPISPGEVTITSGFGGIFGGGDTYKRSGVPVNIEVMPLPAEGRPEGFDPSNVGRYAIETRLGAQSAVVDQPLPVQFIISGTGNIEMVRPPEVKFPQDVKAYEPQVTDSVEVRHFVVGGKKKIEYIVIPTKPGKLVVPAVRFSFFDPEAGKYVTAETKPVEVRVDPSAAVGQGPVVEGSTTQESGGEEDGTIQGLRSIITVASLRPPSSQYIRSRWFIWAIAVPPAILCLMLIVSLMRYSARRVKTRNPATRAMGEARKILRGSTAAGDREVFYGRIQKAIYVYIEHKFGVPASGMTTSELKKSLGDLHVDSRDVESLLSELENCEFARYGRSTDVDQDIRGCAGRVESVLESIERKTGGSGRKNSGKGSGLGAATAAVFLAALFFSPPSAAESVRQIFDSANDLYFKEDYRGAIEKYYKIFNIGIEDTAVYFNTANAFAKMGEYGKAVYFYERVLKIKPRDSATQKNLSIVRAVLARQISNKEKDVSLRPRETVWEGAASWFSPNELVVIFLFFYYLFFGMLIVRKFMKKPVARIGASIFVFFFLAMWILSGAMVLLKYRVDFLRREGVVVDRGLVVSREGPTLESVRKFDVIEGQRITILESRGQWYKIEDEKDRVGWLQRSQIGIL
jgi:tetratricopeptide (TPR) repeat protein